MCASGGAEDATFGHRVARRRERAPAPQGRASSPTADHWQVLQPVVGIIIGNDRTFAAFSGPQPTMSDFTVGGRPAYFFAFANLLDTHCPLQGAALPLSF